MGGRLSRRGRVQPIVTPTDIALRSGGGLRIRPTNKRYFTDGRVLVGSPRAGVMTYPDGSYLCGRFKEGEAEGYCVYRDIAGRIIYTGYMEATGYQGWGAIWSETGEWPEHITFWNNSHPGNRVLRVLDPAGTRGQWVSYREEDPSTVGESVILPQECRGLFLQLRDTAAESIEITEDRFGDVIQLYTMARVAADRSKIVPPSPHHGPLIRQRATDMTHLRLSPETSMPPTSTPDNTRNDFPTDVTDVVKERTVRNPLTLFRTPPRIQ